MSGSSAKRLAGDASGKERGGRPGYVGREVAGGYETGVRPAVRNGAPGCSCRATAGATAGEVGVTGAVSTALLAVAFACLAAGGFIAFAVFRAADRIERIYTARLDREAARFDSMIDYKVESAPGVAPDPSPEKLRPPPGG